MGIPAYPPQFDTDLVRPFYDGLAAGELRMPACPQCGAVYWYPPEVMPCHPEAHPQWRAISPQGVVYSFTTVTRSLLPDDDNSQVPYQIVLVEPDDAPDGRVVGLYLGAEGDVPACGQRVTLQPAPAGDVTLPGFAPA